MSSSDVLVDYSYLGPGGNLAATIVMLLLCIGAVAARFWGRAKAKLGFKADDWLVLISLVLFAGMAVCMFIGVANHALGYPTPKPPPGSPKDEFLFYTSMQQQLIGKLEQAILWQQVWQLGCVKASVVMFYRRVFNVGNTKNWFLICTTTLLVLIALWSIAFFFTLLFACGTDFSANWSTVIALEENCKGSQYGQMAMAITDFSIDMFIITLPLPIVWKLHISLHRKLGVTAVFLLGALAVAASCLRMAMFILVDVSFISPKQDGDWTVDLFLFWSIVESGLAILAACLPSLMFIGQKLGWLTNTALRSLRSVFSLQSIRSRESDIQTNGEPAVTNDLQSEAHMTRIRGETSVKSKISGSSDKASFQDLPSNAITVATSVTRQDSNV